jgi:hypothetical protein
MNVDNVKKWVAALRSGDYKQGKGAMYNANKDTYCCLGVAACLVPGLPIEGRNSAYSTVAEWLGIHSAGDMYAGGEHFVHLNDTLDKSFTEIADEVEQRMRI